MRTNFIRLSALAFFIAFLFQACKKDVAPPAQQANTFSENKVAVSAYTVHSAIRKLDLVKNNTYNYEIAFWVSAGDDSANAIQLTGGLVINYELTTGNKTTPQVFKLKKGSYVTRSFVTLKGPVSLTGISTTPSIFKGKPIIFNNTIIEQTYQLQPIHVQGKNFADANGNAFIPWGVNYTNTNELRLVDDNWYDPANWEIIKQDFREMKALGVNVIRIHLQYNRFMIDAETPNQQALSKLKEEIEFANTYGLYLDITGLCAYIKEDQPAWYDAMDEQSRWATQAVFWKAVAGVAKNYNNVFAYNLMNEPVTPSKNTNDWLPGQPYGGYYFVQNLTRTPNHRSWQTVTNSWITTLKTAIREEDTRTPVTIGFIGLGVTAVFNDQLDYNSAHVYPEKGKMQQSFDFVTNNQTEKPLVIEETNWFAGFDNMENFINTTQSQNQTAGYLSHYLGQTIEQLIENGDLGSAIQAEWYQLFCYELNPNYNRPIY